MARMWEEDWEDFYKVLGLKGGCEACAGVATADQVEHAYLSTKSSLLNLAAAGDENNLVALKLENVEWAHDILGNPAHRRNYDYRFFEMVSNLMEITVIGLLKERRVKRSRMGLSRETEDQLLDPQVVEELGRLVVAKMKLDCAGEVGPTIKMEGSRKRALDYISN